MQSERKRDNIFHNLLSLVLTLLTAVSYCTGTIYVSGTETEALYL